MTKSTSYHGWSIPETGDTDYDSTLDTFWTSDLDTAVISKDTKANRPSAGTSGRWFLATDEPAIYHDNGSSWDKVGGQDQTGNTLSVDNIELAQGTGTPYALHWESDTNTGLYRDAANAFSLATGGSDALSIDSSQNTDFNNNDALKINQITSDSSSNLVVRGQDSSSDGTEQSIDFQVLDSGGSSFVDGLQVTANGSSPNVTVYNNLQMQGGNVRLQDSSKSYMLKSGTSGTVRRGLKYGSVNNIGDNDNLMLTNRESGGNLTLAANNGTGGQEVKALEITSPGGDVQDGSGNLIYDQSANALQSSQLDNNSVTVAGNSVSLGNSTSIGLNDLTSVEPSELLTKTAANLPTAGTSDRLAVETDTGRVLYDNGSSWVEAGLSESQISLANLSSRAHSDLSSSPSSAHHTRPSAGDGIVDNSNTFDARLDIDDGGTDVTTAYGINFGSNLSVTDDSDNTVTVTASTGDDSLEDDEKLTFGADDDFNIIYNSSSTRWEFQDETGTATRDLIHVEAGGTPDFPNGLEFKNHSNLDDSTAIDLDATSPSQPTSGINRNRTPKIHFRGEQKNDSGTTDNVQANIFVEPVTDTLGNGHLAASVEGNRGWEVTTSGQVNCQNSLQVLGGQADFAQACRVDNNSKGFLINDSGSVARYGLKYGGANSLGSSDNLMLTNRSSGGNLLLAANNGTDGQEALAITIPSGTSPPVQVENSLEDSSGNTMAQSVAATGQASLSSGTATVDTGLSATDATFVLALGIDDPDADAKVTGRLFWDDSAGTYKVEIVEDSTSQNPTVNYDIIRVR